MTDGLGGKHERGTMDWFGGIRTNLCGFWSAIYLLSL